MKRHTKRDLVTIFKEGGLHANRLLGQSFLVDHNVLDFVCRAGDLSPNDVVLEIGAGTGLLTQHIAATGALVVAVEIDRNLFEIAQECVGDAENVRLICADIHGGGAGIPGCHLADKNVSPTTSPARKGRGETTDVTDFRNIRPIRVIRGSSRGMNAEVGAVLADALESGRTFKVVSNLPYCIVSDLIVSLLEMPWGVERMVLTVQEEFADRLLARPGSRDYGPLTVLLRARAEVSRLRNLPPSVFWPVPKVGSSVVCIERVRTVGYQLSAISSQPSAGSEDSEADSRKPKAESCSLKADSCAAIADYRLFRSVVSALFTQRRKTAAGALRGMVRPRLSDAEIGSALKVAGIGERARADGLAPAQVVALSNALRKG